MSLKQRADFFFFTYALYVVSPLNKKLWIIYDNFLLFYCSSSSLKMFEWLSLTFFTVTAFDMTFQITH